MNPRQYQLRIAKVRQAMAEQNLPALLVMQAENRRYLSGFTGDAGTLLITPTQAILSTDSRYWEQAEHQAPDYVIHKAQRQLRDWLPELLALADSPARVAFESGTVTVANFDLMKACLPKVEWVSTQWLVEKIRASKDADELAATQKAIDLAEEGFKYLMSILKPGMTEAQAAWELEVYLRTHGSQGLSFNTIIASGPNGAMAHHEPGPRAIQAGEPIIIDWGAQLDGYRSDMTRTVSIGGGDAKYHEIYDVVLRAQEAAISSIKAGMTGRAADALAREVIVTAGYGDHFGHSLGHGVGLAIHEAPPVAAMNEFGLPEGAIVTIEPGIYLPGWGGVRIEDMVLLQNGGAKVLTHLEKKPVL